MDAIKLLLAFSPWIAFWIITSGHSMLGLQIGICVAAALVVVMGLTRLHRGAILWAGVLFFAFALVSVAWLNNIWVIQHLGILASGTLFVTTLFSIFIGRPFTEDYAREHVPKELWESPAFIRGCYTVTTAWGFIFLANSLVNVAKLYYPEAGEWLYRGSEFGCVILGVVFTTIYSQRARRKRLESL
ncbi:MAG: hypothetical protein V1897_12600 [Pseudomonadota bacterium]